MLAANDEELLRSAKEIAKNAYAPYSCFHVGAAILSRQGNIYVGCNIENIAYPLGACAERGAVAQMVAAEGASAHIHTIAIAGFEDGRTHVPCAPCGGCLQVIAEFGPANIVYNAIAGYQKLSINELLPDTFTFGEARTEQKGLAEPSRTSTVPHLLEPLNADKPILYPK